MNQRYQTYYDGLDKAIQKEGDASRVLLTDVFGDAVATRLLHEASMWFIKTYDKDAFDTLLNTQDHGDIWLVFNYLDKFARTSDKLTVNNAPHVVAGNDSEIISHAKQAVHVYLTGFMKPLWFKSYLKKIRENELTRLLEMNYEDGLTNTLSCDWIKEHDHRGRKARIMNKHGKTIPVVYDEHIRHDRLRLPASLVEWALGSQVRMIDLFVYYLLKSTCCGYLHISETRQYVKEVMDIKTDKTFKKLIQRLEERNWIGRDPSCEDGYWIRSTSRVMNMCGIDKESDSTHVFSVKEFIMTMDIVEYEDKRVTTLWRSFLESVACAREANRRKYIDKTFKERKTRRSNPNEHISYSSKNRDKKHQYERIQDRFDLESQAEQFAPEHMSVTLVADVLNVSRTTAHKRKVMWESTGLMSCQHSKYDTLIDTKGIKSVFNGIKHAYATCGYKMYVDPHTTHVFVNLTDALYFDETLKFKRVVF